MGGEHCGLRKERGKEGRVELRFIPVQTKNN